MLLLRLVSPQADDPAAGLTRSRFGVQRACFSYSVEHGLGCMATSYRLRKRHAGNERLITSLEVT